jgi:hypothetical protein
MPEKLTPEQVIEQLSKFIFTINDGSYDEDYSRVDHVHMVFEQNGWKSLSSDGCYSEVYISPCQQYVLKANISTDLYPLYAYWSISNQENPYFPNIYWHFSMVHRADCYRHTYGYVLSVTLMEKLEKSTAEELSEDKDISKLYKVSACDYNGCLLKIQQNKVDVHDTLLGSFLAFVKYISSTRNIRGIDLTDSSNFMIRDGKQVVITDPIVQ